MSRLNQLKRNTIWSLLDLGLYPILMVVATPLFIERLGLENYGIWMLAATITQLMTIFNFGLSESTIQTIATFRGLQNLEKINDSANKYFNQSLLFALIISGLGTAICWSELITNWFNIPVYSISQTKFILTCAVLSAALKLIELVVLSVFKGFERFDKASQFSILSRNSSLISNVVLVLMGRDLLWVFAGNLVVSVINIFLQFVIINRIVPEINLRIKPKFNFNFPKGTQFWYWAQSSIGMIGFLSDRFIIGHLTNLKILGAYSIATLIGSQFHNAAVAIGSFSFPKFALLKAQDQNTENIFHKAIRFFLPMFWGMLLFVLSSANSVFPSWLGKTEYLYSEFFIRYYLIFIAFLTCSILPIQFNNALERPKQNSLFEFILRIGNITCMLLFFKFFGDKGIAIGLTFWTAIWIWVAVPFFLKINFTSSLSNSNFLFLLPTLSFGVFLFGNTFWHAITALLTFLILLIPAYIQPSLKSSYLNG